MRLSSQCLLLQLMSQVHGLPASSDKALVKLEAGIYQGENFNVTENGKSGRRYYGIRYAAPPKRFEVAKPAETFEGVRDATSWAPSCIQQFNYPIENKIFFTQLYNAAGDVAPQSEDCLFLNVFTPEQKSRRTQDLKPVLFWIHGGSLEFGSASSPQYDGSKIAANQDVVVVTANYRLNIFGFPLSPEIPVLERNLGLLDQRLALTWVQQNIRNFGGDPEKVTIFGESAGSASVDMLVVTKPNPPLFRASISQSGTASVAGRNLSPVGDATGFSYFSTVVSGLKCDNSTTAVALACVKAASASDIIAVIEAQNGAVSFQPLADNVTAVADYATRRKTGNVAPVPVLIGSNRNEGSVVLATSARGFNLSTAISLFSVPTNAQALNRIVSVYDPQTPATAIPMQAENDQYNAAEKYFTDITFQCDTAEQTVLHGQAGYPSWRYYYNATYPNTDLYPRSGVYHFSEIFQIFGNFPFKGVEPVPGDNVPAPTDEQKANSAFIQRIWGDYAKNPYAGPGWDEAQTGSVGVIGNDGLRQAPAYELDGDRCSQVSTLGIQQQRARRLI